MKLNRLLLNLLLDQQQNNSSCMLSSSIPTRSFVGLFRSRIALVQQPKSFLKENSDNFPVALRMLSSLERGGETRAAIRPETATAGAGAGAGEGVGEREGTLTGTDEEQNHKKVQNCEDPLGILAHYYKNTNNKMKVIESSGNYCDEGFLEDVTKPLYKHQHSLPRLPVPKIEDTLARFVPTAMPLAETEEEKANLLKAVEKFPKQAEILQQRLEQRYEETKSNSSWLQSWWNRLAYLQYRDPVVIYVSYFFRIAPDRTLPTSLGSTVDNGKDDKQDKKSNVDSTNKDDSGSSQWFPCIARGATILEAVAPYAWEVYTGKKSPQTFGRQNKTVLCSSGYKYMFQTCRIPQHKQDSVKIYWSPPQHAVVACRGQFFTIPLSKRFTRSQYQHLLQQCVDQTTRNNNNRDSNNTNRLLSKLGFLTTWNRDDWANAYHDVLQKIPQMKQALEMLQSGSLLICLDVDDAASTDQDICRQYWHGYTPSSRSQGYYNRWCDKSIQLVVTQNGQVGYVGEHSMMDGLPAVEFCQFLEKNVQYGNKSNNNYKSKMPPHHSQPINIFQNAIESMSKSEQQQITKLVKQAEKDFTKLVDTYELHVQNFQGYGSNLIKQAGLSPDAYVQMALQLAGYRLFGKNKQVGTYESTQVRTFLHGRTETTRSVSLASQAFCKAMADTTAIRRSKNSDDETNKVLCNLLRDAVQTHNTYAKNAAKGLGVDRHFLGLSLVADDTIQQPDLFSDPLFVRSKTWRLSTSTLPCSPGFGPVEDNGVGVGYEVKSNSCIFNLTSRKQNHYTEKLCRLLGDALEEMKRLLMVIIEENQKQDRGEENSTSIREEHKIYENYKNNKQKQKQYTKTKTKTIHKNKNKKTKLKTKTKLIFVTFLFITNHIYICVSSVEFTKKELLPNSE